MSHLHPQSDTRYRPVLVEQLVTLH